MQEVWSFRHTGYNLFLPVSLDHGIMSVLIFAVVLVNHRLYSSDLHDMVSSLLLISIVFGGLMCKASSCSIFVNKAKSILLFYFSPGSFFSCLSFFPISVVFVWLSCYKQVCEKLLFSFSF